MKQDYIKFPLHILVHPFDGFWDMKYEGKGKLRVAFGILLLLVATTIVQNQFAGFLVNYNDPRQLNSFTDFIYVLLPFFLWCIANWSITTLMDGEGKLREIITATAYSMLPLILIYLPTTLASRFMVGEETAFYYLLNSFAALWFLGLLFVGIMTVHQYTATKTIITMFLTVVAMLIIVFLGSLLFSMMQQIYEFIVNVYREIIFRA